MRNLRKRCSQPKVRSTTQRQGHAFRVALRRNARSELHCLDCAARPDGLSKRTLDRHTAYLGVCGRGLLAFNCRDGLYQRDEETRVLHLRA